MSLIAARTRGARDDEKLSDIQGDVESANVDARSNEAVLSNERDIATNVISVDDDTTLNPWTFRAFFLGIGLSTFGGVLGELLRVRPQSSYSIL
jgi:hypothetical protein